jgi:acyl transferase domain-containing protein/acyl carrier protein/NADP-dependent 3-hydroxy acid dehydrogenase YdfG
MTETPTFAIPVAVVGMSAIYPGYPGLDGFWRTITSGRDAITEVPPSHWLIADYFDPDPTKPDHTYCKRGGFIDPVAFDPMQFGLPPNALPATDSAQLLALMAAKEALERARRGNATVDPDRISVVLGVASTTELVVQMGARLQHPIWRKALLEYGLSADDADAICADIGAHYAPWQESTFPGLLGNVVAGRIANRLDLGGSNYVTDAACGSSLAALQAALHELYLHEADMVLTGGVDALNDIMMFMCFSKTPAFSPTGDCRPFSDAADGTIIGEGVGMLALKRLSDAERDGDQIHAVIRGLGSSSDGRASSVYAPRSEGQAKALRRAYERAGYAPSTVGLLEAHGTATKAGDTAEFAGLASVFDDEGERVALGSVKSQIGHTKAAAGAAGLIKAVLSLQHATLPGTLKVDRPNDAVLKPGSPFYVNAQTRPWVHDAEHPRRASVSSFGFGGSNFHVTLEAYEGTNAAKRLRTLPCELVALSAPSTKVLVARAGEIARTAERGQTLAFIAAHCASVFDATSPARAAIVAKDVEMLRDKLGKLAETLSGGETETSTDPDIALGFGPPRAGKTAFVFPGQGSQYVGMGGDLALAFPEALAVWDSVARMSETSGVAQVVFPEPAFDDAARAAQSAALTAMANAQPAIAAASLAQLALLEKLGVRADAFAGHSFGEVTALAAAGVLSRESLPVVARMRGQLMTEAAGARDGAMLAVAANVEEVQAFLAGHATRADTLVIANDNAPGQVVVAGESADIDAAEALFKTARITAFRLKVASAFHSSIVASSVAPFAAFLKSVKFSKGAGVVYANATAAPYGRGPAAQLADQLQRPVRFREMILAMAADGVTRFVEVGPGRILTGLIGQILTDAPHLAVALDDRKAGELRGWHRGLAALAADGVALDLAALFASYDAPVPHTPPPAHAVMVGGANLGKPYPPADGNVTITPRRQIAPVVTMAAPVPAAPAPPAASAPTAPTELFGDAWNLIDRIQSETVQQHRHYLDVMAQSHQAFLDMSSQMLAQVTGAPATPNAPKIVELTPPMIVPPLPPVVAPAVPPPIAAPPPMANTPIRHVSPEDRVLSIVSEKTGYPLDMLHLDMEMEAELGIDSIKQVEILSALQTHYPGSPDIPASVLSTLKTLRDVALKIGSLAPVAPPPEPPSPARALDPEAMQQSVLAIVAEKTGYPVDMLGLDMEMEAELGIDSIKQVEILSALQERWPDAPDVAPSDLAALKTLRDVARALSQLGGGVQETSAAPMRNAQAGGDAPATLSVVAPMLIEAPPSGFAMAGLRDHDGVYVCGGDPEFAAQFVAELVARGVRATAGDAPDGASAVISLSALKPAGTAQAALAQHLEVFRHARAVARSEAGVRLFVAAYARDDSVPMPCGLTGIVKTAAREWENASVRSIAMEAPDAARLVEEILSGGSENEVALFREERFAVVDAPLAGIDVHVVEPRRGGVLLVSGGGRGVTSACAIELAAQHGLKLAFIGRTKLHGETDVDSYRTTAPEIIADLMEKAQTTGAALSLADARHAASRLLARREIAGALDAAKLRGVEAHYFTADVRDAGRIGEITKDVRAHLGPIIGLIHGAGVIADKRLSDLDEAQFAHVFEAKVAGVEALLAATQDDDLQILSLFSSIAARAGNAGQAAYAAANAVLNGIAVREAARRGAQCAVRAFGWGPWDGGMVDATLKRHFERAGVGVIDIHDGAAFFAREAVQSGAPVIVVAAPAIPQRTSFRVEWPVSAHALPALRDHMVQGRIVLPVSVVLERILRAARGVTPSRDATITVRDLQVLSGVTIGADEVEPVLLTIAFDAKDAGYSVTIRDAGQRPRYRATVEWSDQGFAATRAGPPSATWHVAVSGAYNGPLFHGPKFAALAALEDGGARLKTLVELGWPAEPWAMDPAAIDGGLQLGLLWAHGDKRPLMLPQKITRFTQMGTRAAGEPLRCRMAARPVSDKRVDFDLVFETLGGAVVAVLTGAEFYAVGAAPTATP